MGNVRKQFEEKGFDEKAYQRYFHLHQAEYIRKKLRVIKLYQEKKSIEEIGKTLFVHRQTIHKYVNIYLLGGFELLCQEIIRPKKTRLSPKQCLAFKAIILSKKPFEMGLEGNIWTGKLMRQYVRETYAVEYKSGIYDLLKRLNLTHQKAHADYGNADQEAQIKFLTELKDCILEADEDKIVIKFDEFSISEKPTSFYDWAERNTPPRVITNEKKAKEQTDS